MTNLPKYPGERITANGNQLVSYQHGSADRGRGDLLPDHALHRGRRAVPAVVRGGAPERLRPQHARRRGGGGARGPGRRHRLLGVRPPRGQLHVGAGHRLRHRAVLPRPRQGLDDGGRGGGAGPDQARPERPLRARRRVRRPRRRLDHPVRQGRAAGGGPGADPAPRHRAQPDARHERAGRLPDVAPRAHLLPPRIGAHPRVPRRAGGRHRVPDRGAAQALRSDPPPRAADDRPDQPRAPRAGAEPGALHAGRRGPAQQLRRADPAVPGGSPRRLRAPDRPPLRARDAVQDGRRRHRLPLPRLGGRELRGGGRPPARHPRRDGRLRAPERLPALPGAGGGRGAGRQEERHHPGAHGRAAGRRQPDGARHPHRAQQGAEAERAPGGGRLPRGEPRPDAAALQRHLRARLARLPARAHPRRLRVRHERPGADGRPHGGGRRVVHGARRAPPLRGAGRRDPVAPPGGRHRRAVPFHRRVGRDHDRQEPRGHHRRLQRLPLGAQQRGRRVRPAEGGHPRQRQPPSTARRRRERRPPTSSSSRRSASGSTATCGTWAWSSAATRRRSPTATRSRASPRAAR